MAIFVRAKRVTAPLDERVRARLRGEFTDYASSGSDHDGAFSTLLNDFLDSSTDYSEHNNDSDVEIDSSIHISMSSTLALTTQLHNLLSPPSSIDPLRSQLISDVKSVVSITQRIPVLAFRRAVMGQLRERGYNAGICKVRWDAGGGLTAGSYEYIDVVFMDNEERRYIIDLGFSSEFELARATEEYENLVAALPMVMVGGVEEVRIAVKIMSEAARRSLKSRGMSVPPWRKKKYLMAKWLGFYRRTVNCVGVGGEEGRGGEVTWRAVGFGCGGGN